MCVALVNQHAKRMRRVIFTSLACQVVQYFTALFHEQHDFREEVIENKVCVCVLSFSTNFVSTVSYFKKH